LIEMPNLAQRGQAWWTWLLDRYAFGALDAVKPDETPGECRWLVFYTPLAWCYRTFVTVSIIFLVAGKFFIVGVLMAAWSAISLLGVPLYRGWKYLRSAPVLHRRRGHALRRTLTALVCVVLLLGLLPVPLRTSAEGVVWLPRQAMLHAGENGFFAHWLVEPGSLVKTGQPLYILDNPQLRAEAAVDRAKLAQAQARLNADRFSDPTKAAVSARQLDEAREILHQAQTRVDRLNGYAQSTGRLIAATPQDMPARNYKKGELLGYVLSDDEQNLRVIVSQHDIDLVHQRLRGVSLRLTDALGRVWPSRVAREFPGAVEELPTAALGMNGGGIIPTSPSDPDGLKTLQRVFIVDLVLPARAHPAFGERVYIRFDHGSETLAHQLLRGLRQVFLSHFGV
jgi:putative peptide zinc metalloprotease protein